MRMMISLNNKSIAELTDWNIYSPVWAPVSLEGQWLKLQDKDPV